MNSNSMCCLYHSEDLDGIASAAIFLSAYPYGTVIGIEYGKPVPYQLLKKAETLFICDYCINPISKLFSFADMHDVDVVWIDHHATAIDDYEKYLEQNEGVAPIKGLRQRTGKAACELTWEFIYPNKPMPKAIELLGKYDTWRFEPGDGKLEFEYAVSSLGLTPEDIIWDALLGERKDIVQKMKVQGHHILRSVVKRDTDIVKKYGFIVDVDGINVLAVNELYLSSLVFGTDAVPGDVDVLLFYGYTGSGIKFSMRSRANSSIDVGELAKKLGGGGHMHASGFFIPGDSSTVAPTIRSIFSL
jgi:oligoribonuclease NrnB/cAMP/cGMP phosphodiesterase (DHH superfamily)